MKTVKLPPTRPHGNSRLSSLEVAHIAVEAGKRGVKLDKIQKALIDLSDGLRVLYRLDDENCSLVCLLQTQVQYLLALTGESFDLDFEDFNKDPNLW